MNTHTHMHIHSYTHTHFTYCLGDVHCPVVFLPGVVISVLLVVYTKLCIPSNDCYQFNNNRVDGSTRRREGRISTVCVCVCVRVCVCRLKCCIVK